MQRLLFEALATESGDYSAQAAVVAEAFSAAKMLRSRAGETLVHRPKSTPDITKPGRELGRDWHLQESQVAGKI
jgi:hypothetical protein